MRARTPLGRLLGMRAEGLGGTMRPPLAPRPRGTAGCCWPLCSPRML